MRGKMRWPAQTSQQLLRSPHPANYYKNLTFGRTRPFNAKLASATPDPTARPASRTAFCANYARIPRFVDMRMKSRPPNF